MLAWLALVTLKVLVAAQAEPVGPGYSCILGIVISFDELCADLIDLLLEVDQILFDVLSISFLVEEDVDFVDLVPEVGDLLVYCVGCALLLLEVADQTDQVGTLIV